MPDFKTKQGDAGSIIFTDTLTYLDGTAANLSGGSVKFVMRRRSANAPTTNLAATIVSGPAGTVSYTPTADDTEEAGSFASYWIVTFSGGGIQRFPTTGYNTVEIEENLETTNQTIVELEDLKEYLNFPSADRTHDAELLQFLASSVPVIEGITGPILPRTYSERYDGGYTSISVRHRPILSVSQVTEYRGPIPFALTPVTSNDLGTIYSYSFDPSGRVNRRTVGGGMQQFPQGTDTVWITYTAGYQVIPENVRLATMELVRVNYQQTQQAAGGRIGGGSEYEGEPGSQMMGYFVPGRVRELLAPNRRYPSIA